MINRVTLLGHLGQDPELRYTPAGRQVTKLSVATDASYKNKEGQKVERTDWHRVIVFGRTAVNCVDFLRKGSRVYVEGSMSTRKWRDQDGVEHWITEVSARLVKFLDRRGGREEQAQASESEGDCPGLASAGEDFQEPVSDDEGW